MINFCNCSICTWKGIFTIIEIKSMIHIYQASSLHVKCSIVYFFFVHLTCLEMKGIYKTFLLLRLMLFLLASPVASTLWKWLSCIDINNYCHLLCFHCELKPLILLMLFSWIIHCQISTLQLWLSSYLHLPTVSLSSFYFYPFQIFILGVC